MHGVSPAWTVLLRPSERDGRSNVLASDDSLPLDSKILPWFPALCKVLAEGPQEEKIFDLSYQDLVLEFGRSRRSMRIKRLVPYQTRHSGASIDLCLAHRAMR